MPQIDHNGPGFYYEVKWLRADPDPNAQRIEQSSIISDWRVGSHTIPDQPTFVPYDAKVIAHNAIGRSRAADAPPVRGFSGEDKPTDAPKNLIASQIIDGKTVRLEWEPVSPDSVKGELFITIHFITMKFQKSTNYFLRRLQRV